MNANLLHSTQSHIRKIRRKKKIKGDCPHVVTNYNKFIGRVDCFDQNVNDQRCLFEARSGSILYMPLALIQYVRMYGKYIECVIIRK